MKTELNEKEKLAHFLSITQGLDQGCDSHLYQTRNDARNKLDKFLTIMLGVCGFFTLFMLFMEFIN